MDIQATCFATLVDEWARCGVTDAVISPGSRSTLLAAIVASDERIRTHVMVDERSASFFALGLAQATGRPTLLWTATGTAVTELHSAVVEAHQAKVPLLVCTADRPPELHHSRDWQSIEQEHLFDNATRWRFSPGVAVEETRKRWRSIASRAVAETLHHPTGPGPVHLNLAIREPWAYEIGELPPARSDGSGWHTHHRGTSVVDDAIARAVAQPGRKGVIVVGKSDVDPLAVHACAEALGWPVIAEVRSGARLPRPNTVTTIDALLRSNVFAEEMQPDVVIRIGTPPLSRFTPLWLAAADAEEWLIDPFDNWEGSVPDAANIVACDPTEFLRSVAKRAGPKPERWLERWQAAERAAHVAIAAAIPETAISEPGVARTLLRELPDGCNIFAATSMPVRDLEWYGEAREGITMLANRGASGMDGLFSTAAGIALGSGNKTVMFSGDLSFLHDLNGLWATKGAAEEINLVVVLIDNNGGGIFSILPYFSAIDPAVFERVLGTPQHIDIPAVVEALGAKLERIDELTQLMPAVHAALDAGGVRVVYVRTEREANAKLHKDIHAAVQDSIESL